MNKNKHSIQKVFLEIDTSSMSMANSIKNNLALFVQNELFPILEKQFNTIEITENHTIQIDKLEISIDSDTGKTDIFLSDSEPKNDIKNKIEKEIQKALSDVKKRTQKAESNLESRTISSQDRDIKTLLYFIENGNMPWWVSKQDEFLLSEKSTFENLKKDTFKIPFLKLIQQRTIQKRIINQFSNHEIVVFTSALLKSDKHDKIFSESNLIQLLNQKTHVYKTAFWNLIFEFWAEKKPISIISFYYKEQSQFLSDKISFHLFIESIKLLVPFNFTNEEITQIKTNYLASEKEKTISKSGSDSRKEENTAQSETHSTKEKPSKQKNLIKEEVLIEDNHQDTGSKSCYVQNAGLIILHPFFKEMLKNCDLIDDKNTLLNKELAAHILHYAATKKENDYEHLMLFEKFLCGIPLQQSIQREIKIEDWQKEQVEQMLDSVVLHWSALKNTSTAILRSEFLQRAGKLDWSESNPKLTIERKTQDLLLEKIPWNISIVKIPWIQKLIYTQW